MALVLRDRIKETTTTTGTGTYTLAGALGGFEAFSEIGDGNTTYYACSDGTDFEIGLGTYTLSGTTLARTKTIQSTNTSTATASVNGAVTSSTNVAVDGNSGTIQVGHRVTGTGITGIVNVATVTSQTAIVLDTSVTLADNAVLSFAEAPVNWSAGTRTIFCTLPAEQIIFNDTSDNIQGFTEQDPNALAFAIALG